MPGPGRRGNPSWSSLIACLAATLLLIGCASGDRMPATVAALPGWSADGLADALPALNRSCHWLAGRPAASPTSPDAIAGHAADWQVLCADAAVLPAGDHVAARAFFERAFRPVPVAGPDGREGLFTGYFAPLLRGSWQRDEVYRVPLYRTPPTAPDEALPTRAEIAAGALSDRGLELLWVDNPIDAFFLHIQGSGDVVLPDGSRVGVGYDGHNGHPYFAIGRALIERGEATRDAMSMALIRDWLTANPDQADALMNLNPSFIFFAVREPGSAIGSLGVPLTAGRSLAVDRTFVPLGFPLWLDIVDPSVPGGTLRRLVVAQDTGSAIRGPVRGDLFWGYGEEAGQRAGGMRALGGYYLLVPRISIVGDTIR